MIEVDLQLERPGFVLSTAFRTDARIIGLFGASGAGKSTIVGALAGLVRPDRGLIRIADRVLLDSTQGIDVPAHRRRVGVVFQDHRLFPHFSAERNLRYAMRHAGTPESDFACAVDTLELGPLLDRRPHQLSGGEKQRVAIGRALLSSPAALLLDEPLASLDLRLRSQLLGYLRRLIARWSVPVVYVSHDLSELLCITDELVVMDRGRVAGRGEYTRLVHDPSALRVLHERGMTNVVRARAVRDADASHSAVMEIGEGDRTKRVIVPRTALWHASGPGDRDVPTERRLVVRPADIALAAGRIEHVSIQNQLEGEIRRVSSHEEGVIVEVEAGATWIVEVSARAAEDLKLEPGRRVVCLIKSHAIRVE